MRPTDIFTFYAVDPEYDRTAAAIALAPLLSKSTYQEGLVALDRGLISNCEDAQRIYNAVRPHGYAVRGLEMGRVGPLFRP